MLSWVVIKTFVTFHCTGWFRDPYFDGLLHIWIVLSPVYLKQPWGPLITAHFLQAQPSYSPPSEGTFITSGPPPVDWRSERMLPTCRQGLPKTLLPPKQTWNLKMDPWKRRFLLETIISRFHVNCMPYVCRYKLDNSQVVPRAPGCETSSSPGWHDIFFFTRESL